MTLSVAITIAITALAVLATAWTVLKAIREAYSDGYHQGWDDYDSKMHDARFMVRLGDWGDAIGDGFEELDQTVAGKRAH